MPLKAAGDEFAGGKRHTAWQTLPDNQVQVVPLKTEKNGVFSFYTIFSRK
jgi:hypothetical protein